MAGHWAVLRGKRAVHHVHVYLRYRASIWLGELLGKWELTHSSLYTLLALLSTDVLVLHEHHA